jgi:hypothetical protein
VRADWGKWIQVALDSLYVKSFERGVDALAKKVSTGNLHPADFEAQRTALKDYIRTQNERAAVFDKLPARDAVLAIGPRNSNWDNGAHSAHLGLWLALLWFAFFLFITLSNYAAAADTPFGSIVVLRAVLAGVLPWLISGFFSAISSPGSGDGLGSRRDCESAWSWPSARQSPGLSASTT